MRVAGHDDIDARRETVHHLEYLAGAGRASGAESAHVARDDDHVGALRTQRLRARAHHGCRVDEAQIRHVHGAGRVRRLDRADADDAHLQRSALHDDILPDPRRHIAERVAQVGRQDGVRGLRDACPQRVLPVVELVIAQRRGRDADGIHQRDHRAAVREVRGGRALKLVAAIHDHRVARRRDASGLCAADRGHECTSTTQQPAVRAEARFERAVEVVHADHAQSGAVERRAIAPTLIPTASERCLCRGFSLGRHDAPVHGCPVGRIEPAGFSHRVHDHLANVAPGFIYERRTGQHRVPATTRLPIIAQRDRERVTSNHRRTVDRQSPDALPCWLRQIHLVCRTHHHVDVVARHVAVDE